MPFRTPQIPAVSPRGTTPGSPGPPGPIDIFDERPADYPKDRRGQPPWDPNYKMTPAMPEEEYKKFKGLFGPEVRKHAWDDSGVNFPYPRPMPNEPDPRVQGPPEPPFRWPTTDPYSTPKLPPTVEEAPRADSWEWDLPLGPRENIPRYIPPYTKGLGPYYEGSPKYDIGAPFYDKTPIEQDPDTYHPRKTIPDHRPGQRVKINPDWYPPLDPKLHFPGGYQPGYHRPGVYLDDNRYNSQGDPVPPPIT
jgi:hypothetical protein